MSAFGCGTTLAALALLAFALPSGAATPSGTVAMYGVFNVMPWGAVLQPIVNSLTGPTAIMVSILGVAVAGGMLVFGGEYSDLMRRMVMVCLTVGLLIGSRLFLWNLFGISGAVLP